MQVHLIAGQTDAVVDKIATVNSTQSRVGVENIGRPFFDCRFRKQPREPVCAARDRTHAGDGLAQLSYELNAGRAGRANNRNFHHDGRGLHECNHVERWHVRCANLCFGGLKRNRLFMAASHSVYSLYVNTQGEPGG